MQLQGVRDAVDIAAGEALSAAVLADGTVRIWANGKGPTEWVLKPIPLFKVVLDH